MESQRADGGTRGAPGGGGGEEGRGTVEHPSTLDRSRLIKRGARHMSYMPSLELGIGFPVVQFEMRSSKPVEIF